jgi:predicted TPR repeat methyltransferase
VPKEDWQTNTIQSIFERAGLYPKQRISTVLDVACGLSLKSQYIDADIRVGVDIYRPYLEKIETSVPYVTVVHDVRRLDEVFIDKSFDLVLMLDIIEHLEKHESLALLKTAERLAKVAVIIETPEGYIPQNIDIWGHGGDEWQTHRCGWEKAELEALGFNVIRRPYTMSAVRRHTEIDVPVDVNLLDGIKYVDR